MKKLFYIVVAFIIQHSSFNIQNSYAQTPNDHVGSGNCLEFHAVLNEFVSIPHNTAYDFGTGDFTIEFWMRSDGTSLSEPWFLSKLTHGNSFWGFTNRNNANLLSFELWNGPPSHLVTSTTVFNDNIWKHIAVTRVSGEVRLYVNGLLEDSFITSRNMNFTGPIEIGRATTYGYLGGEMDELKIWNISRTQAQIKNDMCQQLLGNEAGLVGYWNMNEGTGNTVGDLTSNSNNGTRQ